MPKFSAQSSITIKKSAREIIDVIANFQTWPTWSPWLIMEPKCRVTYEGDMGEPGSSYQWRGDMVGAGEMTLTEITDTGISCELLFIKPYKSRAHDRFTLQETEQGTIVTWSMSSSLPWFMFWMTKSMSEFISMDYQRGLLMLKSLLEEGKVPSRLSAIGDQTASSLWYIALEATATTDQLGAVMAKDFTKLANYFAAQHLHATGKPFALYFDMDMQTSRCTLHNCLPVAQQHDVDPPFICAQLPTKETFAVAHTGAYGFVGNAWSFAMMLARHKKIKTNKSPIGLERYVSDPSDVAPDDLVTEVALFKRL
ncbi:SRPBCC family protein [Salinibius halmophilus]|uniref:SRPBCC family protein n=1 Tax=Salinibius halmophilus TaxID=1853216 RepID=UPI000E66D3AD|nr:SRPBCC family protein [Salinibius halmophilus]